MNTLARPQGSTLPFLTSASPFRSAGRFFIGTVRELPGERRYRSLPDESLPGAIEPWEAFVPVRPDTPHSRALCFIDTAGELLTAMTIIAGGVFAYGYLPLA